jgi:hypothetical protein
MPALPFWEDDIEPHKRSLGETVELDDCVQVHSIQRCRLSDRGATLIIWPGVLQTLFREEAFVGHEGALMRVIGLTIVVIGWLYVFGGRSGARQIVAASVIDRLVFVSLVAFAPGDSGGLSPLVGGLHDTRRVARHRRLVADPSQMNVCCPLSPWGEEDMRM